MLMTRRAYVFLRACKVVTARATSPRVGRMEDMVEVEGDGRGGGDRGDGREVGEREQEYTRDVLVCR